MLARLRVARPLSQLDVTAYHRSMDARDDHDKVRPIPLGDADVGVGDTAFVEDADGESPMRPWLPLSIALVALIIVVGSVAAFGALRFDDPPPSDEAAFTSDGAGEDGSTTTAPALNPRLDELLPGTTDRLTLIAQNEDGLWALLWDPSFREPKPLQLDVAFDEAINTAVASFDSGGRFLAVMTCIEGATVPCELFVGSPTNVGPEPDVRDTTSFLWHSSEVGRIAWLDGESPNATTLATGSVNPLSGRIEDVDQRFPVSERAALVRWDTEGFVLATPEGTLVLTGDGEPVWTHGGTAITATDMVVGIVENDGTWTLLDRTFGKAIESPALGSIDDSVVFIATSDAANLIGRLAHGRASGSGSDMSLTITGGSLRAPRILTIPQRFGPLGFTADAEYFLLTTADLGDIGFVDWRIGATRVAALPPGYSVIALDLG